MPSNTSNYAITKVRLVNFHNLGTVTFDIRNGGHLFLLGDNGSGKTTVLDAIHFVLTAGRSMEFNSAARVTGSKSSGGRNVQGIVMRYNVETNGPLNPEGGITYAALELESRKGKKTSICIGLSARSMDEQYESWAAICDMPVEDLPLIHTEGKRMRPNTRAEFKEALGNKGYYGKVGSYAEELANRFFSDTETYQDVCKLIATGKAYREIAARAGDYDKLFRELLQEPPKDVFNRLITDLRTLDESKQKLEEIRKNVEFIKELAQTRHDIGQARVNGFSALWMRHQLDIEKQKDEQGRVKGLLDAEKCEHARLSDEEDKLRDAVERSRLRLEELRRQDPENLSVRERELRLLKEEAERKFRNAKNNVVSRQTEKKETATQLSKECAQFSKMLGFYSAELLKAGRDMPFSVNEIVSAYDDAARNDFPEDIIKDVSLREVEQKAQEERSRLDRAKADAETKIDNLNSKLSECNAELAKLKAQKEPLPHIDNFAEADKAVADEMLDAFPLYRKLEPAPGLADKEIAILEQVIGDDILGTWLVTRQDADSLRKLFFQKHQEQSIIVTDANAASNECRWLKDFFDIDKSDPDALLALGKIISSKSGPRAGKFLDTAIMYFRGRERPSLYTKPRLIGGEARAAELQRRIREFERTAAEITKEIKAAQSNADDIEIALESAIKIFNLLSRAAEDTSRGIFILQKRRADAIRAESLWQAAYDEMYSLEDTMTAATERHNDILVQMQSKGIGTDLEARIAKTERETKKLSSEHDECVRDKGKSEERINTLTLQIASIGNGIDKTRQLRAVAEKALLEITEINGDIAEFAATNCGDRTTSTDELDNWIQALRDQGTRLVERLKAAIRSNDGIEEGFVYDEAPNTIINRRGTPVDEVLAEKSAKLAEQESIITDDTRRLFQTFIMEDIMKSMQESVMRLSEMEHKMRRLLGNRRFGQNRYAFAVTPVPEYERIIRVVKNYHALAPDEKGDDMKSFVTDHLDEITATQAGDIPSVLDYRNWFRYDLKIITENDTGKVIDRKIKSMGSGGEQAVPNYLLILTIADFLYSRDGISLPIMLFDEAFYGIDAGRRDQILSFATDIGLQLFVASPDQDGVKKEIPLSTTIFVVKDTSYNVHLYPYHWNTTPKQDDLLAENANGPLTGGEEI